MIAYSCVVDSKPRYEWQAFVLVHSILNNVKCDPNDIKVHCLPDVTGAFRSLLHNLKIDIIDIEPFEGNHPYCNKIEQCFSPALLRYDKVILMDCDLFFLSKPILSDQIEFAAKVVDMPLPPLDILMEVYQKAKIPLPREVPVDCALSDEDMTFEHNLNGGVYYIDSSILDRLGITWKNSTHWLLSTGVDLGEYKNHVDQIAMGLALDKLGINVQSLSAQTNFPVHLPKERIRNLDAGEISVLHYHSSLLPNGQIKFTGVPKVDAAIGKANDEIEAIIREGYDNVLFWNFQYNLFPELGSGIRSRGETLAYKRDRLANSIEGFLDKKAIDVGCGDLETTKEFKFQYYTGYDLSLVALNIAQKKRPDWSFVQGSISNHLREAADLVICLDVLLHQKTPKEYQNLLSALVQVTRKRLIVSGYDAPPSSDHISNICFYHEPLSKSLKETGVFNEILEVGQYRGISLFVADKVETGVLLHKNDLPVDVFDQIIPIAKRKDLLRLAIDISRKHLGFYTKTSIRAVEYPWILERLLELETGSEIIDIGSGISPLPIILSDKGYYVNCVDNHSNIRTYDKQSEWNEWGFLDYSQISSNLKSFNIDILKFRPGKRVDAIYSVSVLEHMPRSIWEQTLKRTAKWLRPGGVLLLTLDLQPESDSLWNLSEDKEVDLPDEHGTLKELLNVLVKLNFDISEFLVQREIPYSRTDVAFISCKLNRSPSILELLKTIFS